MDANIERRKLNKIKVVLAEHGYTGRWLASQLQKDPELFLNGVLIPHNQTYTPLKELLRFLMFLFVNC